MKNTPNYYILYTDGTTKEFYAPDMVSARWYFEMEGDHAYSYGQILSFGHKKPRSKRGLRERNLREV